MPKYWILKSEPSVYDFADLEREGRTVWDGVSNAQALIHIRSMSPGDRALVYHSNEGKELVGLGRVVSEPYPDPKLDDPKRAVVDLEFDRWLPRRVTLAELKADPTFAELGLIRQGRLSVIPVPAGQWGKLLAMAGVK
jgi:predicted RNA-binding protein with PUA-like domain